VSILDALKAHWAAQGIASGDPAPAADLASFEARYRVRLPPALRGYFAEVNGIRRTVAFETEMDEDMIRFWPLDEVRPLSDEWPESPVARDAASLFVLADWSIAGWFYVARLSEAETMAPICIVDGGLNPVADSFEAFLERYLTRDLTVLFPPT
jgi:hypothetical protein